MKLKLLLTLFLLLVFVSCSNSGTEPEGSQVDDTIPTKEGWKLVWHDEFETDGSPDASKWFFEHGPDWHNGELQYYTNGREENVRVENGWLVLEARHEEYEGKDYTSTRINSVPGWKYGRIEVKAKIPKGNSLWPAIWMLPTDMDFYGGWPRSGEIDIMENWSWNANGIYGTIHTEAYNHIKGTQKGGEITVSSPYMNFHVYTIEWTMGKIDWYVDDTLYFSFENEGNVDAWPFNHPFRLLLNIAVEGTAPGQEETWVKRTMEIDYVRVFELAE